MKFILAISFAILLAIASAQAFVVSNNGPEIAISSAYEKLDITIGGDDRYIVGFIVFDREGVVSITATPEFKVNENDGFKTIWRNNSDFSTFPGWVVTKGTMTDNDKVIPDDGEIILSPPATTDRIWRIISRHTALCVREIQEVLGEQHLFSFSLQLLY